MKRNRVSLGEANRPQPTQGFVRKRPAFEDLQSRGRKSEIAQKSSNEAPPITTTTPNLKIIGDVVMKSAPDEVERILENWKKLPLAEKKKVIAMLSLDLQSSDSVDDRDVDMWAMAVFEAICAAIGPSDGASHGPQVVRRLMAANSAWAPFAEFMENARMHSLRPAEKFAVFRLLAKLLVARAKRVAQRADIPLTLKLVAQNTQHIAGIFDNAFPGYLANGLVASVSRMLIGNPAAVARVLD